MLMSRFAIAAFLAGAFLAPAPLVLAGGGPTPEILQGDFSFDDDKEVGNNCSVIEIDGTDFSVSGTVTGIGISDDTVTISYFSPFVDKVSAKSTAGLVSEKTTAEITVDIAPGAGSPTAAFNGSANPDKGRVIGKITKAGEKGKVGAQFELGADLGVLTPAPDTAQVDSIVEAFRGRRDVRVRPGNGKVKIRHKGSTAAVCP